MRKTLRAIAFASGLVSIASTVILAYLYAEDISGHFKNLAGKFKRKKSDEE